MSDSVYTPGGRVAHYLNYGSSPNDTCAQAMCGRSTWPGLWHGTGSSAEREKARNLPLCRSCVTARTRDLIRRQRLEAEVVAKREAAQAAMRARITEETLGEALADTGRYGYGPAFAEAMNGENSD